MKKKKLPIGKQTFRNIRDSKDNYVYIDKTMHAHRMIESGSDYYFLSRPRRFGKSLFLDTLSEIFLGSKELFRGLYIESRWDWEQRFPVIKIDFTSGNFSSKELIEEMLQVKLKDNVDSLQLNKEDCFHPEPGVFFQNLIKQAFVKNGKKVVVLIDEYDKPILDNIGKEDKTAALQAREILKGFYTAIKASDQYLEFVFITGVSKFSKLNLFSGLNNIEDVTIDMNYATITGYTQADLEKDFAEYIADADIELVKKWYNGYNYFGEPVYNPYDILLFFSKNCEFANYWWETGNPSFLVEKLKEKDYFLPELENITVSPETLNAFDVEHIDLVALLWQTGYLTFDSKLNIMEKTFYRLKVPNLEILSSLNSLFFDYLTNLKNASATSKIMVAQALLKGNLDAFNLSLKALFSSIPYNNYTKNNIAKYEGYYASVVFAFLSSLGFTVITEDATNHARVDMTLIGPASIFVLEFKVDKENETALQQLEDRKYHEKYLVQNKAIYLIGILFSSKDRNISGFEYKLVSC